ncbi:MAG: hypothetical protein QOE70_2715 [Chthoniobacter sp.]|jgi:1-acyl-sn-glycerol-3-phosphate acyltransferase|nr:hypothetical protein [Chthoniobacter sp.]
MRQRTLAQAFVYRAIRSPLFARVWVGCFHAMFGLKRHGEEFIPPERPLIFAGNHASHWDGLFSITAVYEVLGEPPAIVAWGGVRRLPGTREIVETGALSLIVADEKRTAATGARVVAAIIAQLKSGRSVVLHAEGRRGDALGPFKPGAAFASLQTGAPIIPFTLRGVHGLWRELPWPDRWHASVGVHFHPPIEPARYAHLFRREAVAAMTAELRCRVASAIDYPDALADQREARVSST